MYKVMTTCTYEITKCTKDIYTTNEDCMIMDMQSLCANWRFPDSAYFMQQPLNCNILLKKKKSLESNFIFVRVAVFNVSPHTFEKPSCIDFILICFLTFKFLGGKKKSKTFILKDAMTTHSLQELFDNNVVGTEYLQILIQVFNFTASNSSTHQLEFVQVIEPN